MYEFRAYKKYKRFHHFEDYSIFIIYKQNAQQIHRIACKLCGPTALATLYLFMFQVGLSRDYETYAIEY